ncbi:MAG: AbrB family transcriptional regulator [Candidatus Thermoplasmatota archaeon]|nr:AbrB family transcriptional regulator [Candidatus Thermoplasmatota archaeon]MDD5778669.1 AbrB family transcriptional regulator [Candidatus Thermoplasmatota archaeon]
MAKIGWNKTKVHYSTDKHQSLRTTIPIAFANIVGLKKGDVLRWDIYEENNAKYLIAKVV